MSPPLTAIRRQKNYHRGAEAQRKRLTCGAPRAAVFETLLPAVFVTQPYTLRLGHVMKRELLWDPCLDIAGQRTRVAFLAHVGFEGTASLNDIWSGKLIGRTIRLCFRRVPSAEIPQTAEGRVEWLDTEWARVDAWTAYAGSRPAQAA